MRKIHVLTRKEEIDPVRIKNGTAVVIDVLFATSTIATALFHGAKKVIPVMNKEDALRLADSLPEGSFVLSGEQRGYTIENFRKPDPVTFAQSDISGKTVIYTTTNGTVAIKKLSAAKAVYVASILNGAAVAKSIIGNPEGGSVLIVCSGSGGRFAMEDMIGAGYIIAELVRRDAGTWHLSDAARAAFILYQSQSATIEEALLESEIGVFLSGAHYEEAIRFAARRGVLPVVPRLRDNWLIIDESDK